MDAELRDSEVRPSSELTVNVLIIPVVAPKYDVIRELIALIVLNDPDTARIVLVTSELTRVVWATSEFATIELTPRLLTDPTWTVRVLNDPEGAVTFAATIELARRLLTDSTLTAAYEAVRVLTVRVLSDPDIAVNEVATNDETTRELTVPVVNEMVADCKELISILLKLIVSKLMFTPVNELTCKELIEAV